MPDQPQTLPERIEAWVRANYPGEDIIGMTGDLIDVAAGNRPGSPFERRAIKEILAAIDAQDAAGPTPAAPATKRIAFTGYSDDTFACEGPGIDVDYDTCASGRPVRMRVSAAGRSLIVVGQYAPKPCAGWLIGVAPDDWPGKERAEDQPLPGWPFRFEPNKRVPYSPLLVIEAPSDVVVKLIDEQGTPLKASYEED